MINNGALDWQAIFSVPAVPTGTDSRDSQMFFLLIQHGDAWNTMLYWLLVVWLPFFIFPSIGFLIIPLDEVIFFRGVAQPPTRCGFSSSDVVKTSTVDRFGIRIFAFVPGEAKELGERECPSLRAVRVMDFFLTRKKE